MVEPPKDEIRQYSSAFGSAQERIEKIYIPNDAITGRLSDNVASIVRNVTNGSKQQTLNPIVNGFVKLKLSDVGSGLPGSIVSL